LHIAKTANFVPLLPQIFYNLLEISHFVRKFTSSKKLTNANLLEMAEATKNV